MLVECVIDMGPVTRSRSRGRSGCTSDMHTPISQKRNWADNSNMIEETLAKRKRISHAETDDSHNVRRHWFKQSFVAFFKAGIFLAGLAIFFFAVHHQLQAIYFRTCRANLLAVVLHNQSDVCHGLNLVITAIERGYQMGVVRLMQWGASAAALIVPFFFSFSSDTRWKSHVTNQSSFWHDNHKSD